MYFYFIYLLGCAVSWLWPVESLLHHAGSFVSLRGCSSCAWGLSCSEAHGLLVPTARWILNHGNAREVPSLTVYRAHYITKWASLVAQMVKNLPAMRETWVWSLDWEDPLEEGMATHSSILAWRIPMDRGAWQAIVHGVTKSWTWLSDQTTTYY